MSNFSFISDLSDKAILAQIGHFVQQQRIEMNMTQSKFARKAAISRSTLSLIERGENSSVLNLIKVLRTLDALHVLRAFRVTQEPSPLQLAEGEKKQRKRASGRTDQAENGDLGW